MAEEGVGRGVYADAGLLDSERDGGYREYWTLSREVLASSARAVSGKLGAVHAHYISSRYSCIIFSVAILLGYPLLYSLGYPYTTSADRTPIQNPYRLDKAYRSYRWYTASYMSLHIEAHLSCVLQSSNASPLLLWASTHHYLIKKNYLHSAPRTNIPSLSNP